MGDDSCSLDISQALVFILVSLLLLEKVSDILLQKYVPQYTQLDRVKQCKILRYIRAIPCKMTMFVLAIYICVNYWDWEKGLILTKQSSNTNISISSHAKCGNQIFTFIAIFFLCQCLFDLIKIPEFSWDYWFHHLTCIVVVIYIQNIYNNISTNTNYVSNYKFTQNWTQFWSHPIQSFNDCPFDPFYLQFIALYLFGTSILVVSFPSMIEYHFTDKQDFYKQYKLFSIKTGVHWLSLIIFSSFFPFILYIVHFDKLLFASKIFMPILLSFFVFCEVYIGITLYKIWKKKRVDYIHSITTLSRTNNGKRKSLQQDNDQQEEQEDDASDTGVNTQGINKGKVGTLELPVMQDSSNMDSVTIDLSRDSGNGSADE